MKRTLKLLPAFLIAFLITSCKSDVTPSIPDLTTDIMVLDQRGNNLLSTSSANSYKFEDIRLFSVENGKRNELINSGASKYFQVIQDNSGRTLLRINPDVATKSSVITTAINWRANDEDVIEISSSKSSNKSHYDNVKCNGSNVHQPASNPAARYVEIVKQR
ncbi:MAG: hypothetical protein HOP08_00370 [Cyclobacteriaceae bacterium]|nr:hypothetical protein [Cyclobacteriaceae bacterium]